MLKRGLLAREVAHTLGRGVGIGVSGGSAPSGGSSPLLFSDTFTDTNGVLLTAHTPDVDVVGGGWVFYTKTYDIQSNQASSIGSSTHLTAADTGEADVTVEATAKAGSDQAIVARLSDALNCWMGLVNTGILYEKNEGSFTVRADVGSPSALPNTMSLECSGSSITFATETGLSATYASAVFNQTATKHGIRCSGGLVACDDFSVNIL